MEQVRGVLGLVVLLGLAWAFSEARRRVSPRVVLVGLALQFLIATVLLKFPPAVAAFDFAARVVTRVIGFADAGTEFIFGKVADPGGPWGFVFAVRVLPVIIFFASLMSVLYHLGVMQRVVAGMAAVLRRALGVTGAEALSAAANIFLGQTEAPLCVKPYIPAMTRSQLMAVMTGGFATIAGSVMAAYIMKLGGESEAGRVLFAKHLITASVMSAPAGFVFAKILVPEQERPREESVRALMADERTTANVVDAAAAGAGDGLRLALNVAAMLVAFVALIALINWPLSALSGWGPVASWRAAHGLPELSLQSVLGTALMPLAWVMGVPWEDCRAFGGLLGTQVVATEFVAYLDLSGHVERGTMSPRASQMAAYALCGFANLPSIGIQIGGLSGMAPERRSDVARLAPRAMLAGALACWMTATVAGIVL